LRTRGEVELDPVAVDVAALDGPAQLITRATQEHDQVAVLVNNVGAGQCTEHCTLLSALGGLPVPSRPKVVEPPAGMAPS